MSSGKRTSRTRGEEARLHLGGSRHVVSRITEWRALDDDDRRKQEEEGFVPDLFEVLVEWEDGSEAFWMSPLGMDGGVEAILELLTEDKEGLRNFLLRNNHPVPAAASTNRIGRSQKRASPSSPVLVSPSRRSPIMRSWSISSNAPLSDLVPQLQPQQQPPHTPARVGPPELPTHSPAGEAYQALPPLPTQVPISTPTQRKCWMSAALRSRAAVINDLDTLMDMIEAKDNAFAALEARCIELERRLAHFTRPDAGGAPLGRPLTAAATGPHACAGQTLAPTRLFQP